jgi:hypothetical protein
MTQSKPTVAVLPSSAMAEVVRKQLEAAGIETATVEAEGDFQLQVAEADFARAMQLLFPMPGSASGSSSGAAAAPWKCAHCGEEVQPVSDVCWGCGKPKAGAAAATALTTTAPPSAPLPSASLPPTLPPGDAEPPVVRGPMASSVASNRGAVSEKALVPDGAPASQTRPPRTRAPEPREPWDPWLIALWTLIVIAICVIAWLALR